MRKLRKAGSCPGFMISVLAASVLLGGCTNALHYKVASLTQNQRDYAAKHLTVDQMGKLDAWIRRTAAGGKSIAPDVTVGMAIDDQADWIANELIGKARADEQQRTARAAHAAEQRALAGVLGISLSAKNNLVQPDGRHVVSVALAYDNRADKDIRAVTGILRLADVYGNPVIDLDWNYQGIIAAKHGAAQRDVPLAIDDANPSRTRLWATDFARLTAAFEIRTITFGDGSALNASQ